LPAAPHAQEYMKLLVALDCSLGQRRLGAFAAEVNAQHPLCFWTDTLDFRSIPSADYRRVRAQQVFRRYCAAAAPQPVGFVSDAARAEMAGRLERGEALSADFFTPLRRACLREIYERVYAPLRADEARFAKYEAELQAAYNHVSVDDFDYMELLGSGGFGRVVLVYKRSTQRHYAMKVQHKRALVNHYRNDHRSLGAEMAALATCSHPFIMRMEYALHTDEHAILVLELITTGTLQDALDASPYGKLAHDSVRFYVAEVALALLHLHECGLMYRDLKPRNVMVAEDGHVRLVDLGGVADFKG
ncbi:kinase-like domain-containing protein, partial [Tribonema minus]